MTTPSWPGAGSKGHPRDDGNTLGCVSNDNNVLVAQSFFAVRLSPDDAAVVLKSLANASVVTNTRDPQIFRNGGPAAIRTVAASLGAKTNGDEMLVNKLSTGLHLLAKPSQLHASPWHLVSSVLGSVNLLVATWRNPSDIPDTNAHQNIKCWPSGGDWKLPGAVVNARSGHWDAKSFGLLGVGSAAGNRAKIGVATSGSHPYAIFGDLNQEGALSGNCGAKQNGRGGMFFVVEDQKLRDSVRKLISIGPPKVNP